MSVRGLRARVIAVKLIIVAVGAAALIACGPGRLPAGSPPPEPPAPAETAPADSTPATSRPVVFATDVQPILERCRPCHFEGGKMYEKLPFDSPDTIRSLGTALFTRIKDEEEQAIIRVFLDQESTSIP